MVDVAPQLAVIGCGYWGKNLVRVFHQLGALGAVHDTNSALAAEFSARYDAPALDIEEVFDRPEISGVVIAAPAEYHASLAVRALRADKHVFVEKPLALRSTDGEEVVSLAEERGRVLMVGHLLQYHPGYLRLKDLVDTGRLGRIQYIYSNRLNLGKIRREENVFWSFAPHDLSMILALVGESPDSIQATGYCYLHKSVADITTTQMTFRSGINAHVFVSWLHPFKEQKLIVVGEKAMAVFDDRRPYSEKLAVYKHGIEWRNGCPEPTKADAKFEPLEQAEPLLLECQHFLNCIANQERPRTDGAEGLRVLNVLEAAERAMAEGQTICLSSVGSAPPSQIQSPRSPSEVFIHESAYVDQGCEVGDGTRIWHFTHLYESSRVGRNCTIGQNVMVGPDVSIGDNCKIQNNVSLYKGVKLEEGVFCGPSCVFTNVHTPRAGVERKDQFRSTLLRRGVTIGANATIVCGHELGAYCFIAAGAVVTRDVPPYALMVGIPAHIAGWMCQCGVTLAFNGGQAVCASCGKHYRKCSESFIELQE